MSAKTYPLISVIVPIYNVEAYLHKCVDSILSQTYKNIEIFLVDDGSPDNCGKICDEYASKDKRIKVIHKQNGGLSDARNVALDVVKGEFVTFVDSDDFISPTYIELLFELIELTKSDIAECSFLKVTENEEIPHQFTEYKKLSYKVFSADNALKNILYQNTLNHSAWGKLYKKTLFNNIRYPKGILYEDLAIIYQVFQKVENLVFTPIPLYYYLLRENSILGRFNFKRLIIFDILKDLEEKIGKQNFKLQKATRSRNLSAHFNILSLIIQNNMPFNCKEGKECWDYIKKNRAKCFFDIHVRLKNKIGILISYAGLNILKKFLKYNHR